MTHEGIGMVIGTILTENSIDNLTVTNDNKLNKNCTVTIQFNLFICIRRYMVCKLSK